MILKYILTDNILKKEDATMYPNLLQDNVKLEFTKTDETLPNAKYYADIKTHDNVKKVKLTMSDGKLSCDLPRMVSSNTFFKLSLHTIVDDRHFTTNELIVPIRVNDYLDYQRTVSHPFRKERMRTDAIYDEHMNRYDGKWKYPNIPHRVRNV